MINYIGKMLAGNPLDPRRVSTESRESSARDHKIIEILYDKHADDLFHYALSLSNANVAQDVSQNFWLKLLEKPQRVKHQQAFKRFMFISVRNAVIDEYRKQQKFTALPLENIEACNTFNDSHSQRCFDQALISLSFEQKDVFCLQQEGFSLYEIADITATPFETVKTRLRYAREKLRKALENSHE